MAKDLWHTSQWNVLLPAPIAGEPVVRFLFVKRSGVCAAVTARSASASALAAAASRVAASACSCALSASADASTAIAEASIASVFASCATASVATRSERSWVTCSSTCWNSASTCGAHACSRTSGRRPFHAINVQRVRACRRTIASSPHSTSALSTPSTPRRLDNILASTASSWLSSRFSSSSSGVVDASSVLPPKKLESEIPSCFMPARA